jgi:hypothetical protein
MAAVFQSSPAAMSAGTQGIMEHSDLWGKPPENNAPVVVPDLPKFLGWYWLLGAEYPAFLAANEQFVLASDGSVLTALDAASGREVWHVDKFANLSGADPRLLEDVVVSTTSMTPPRAAYSMAGSCGKCPRHRFGSARQRHAGSYAVAEPTNRGTGDRRPLS